MLSVRVSLTTRAHLEPRDGGDGRRAALVLCLVSGKERGDVGGRRWGGLGEEVVHGPAGDGDGNGGGGQGA